MPSFRDLGEVTAYLSSRDLPFAWYVMGPDDRAFTVEVSPRDVAVATGYFDEHALALSDGTPIKVLVASRRGESWTAPSVRPGSRPDDHFDYERLVGSDVSEAAALASSAGWFVRAHEAEAMVTADFHPGRLNLCYDDDRVVTSVRAG